MSRDRRTEPVIRLDGHQEPTTGFVARHLLAIQQSADRVRPHIYRTSQIEVANGTRLLRMKLENQQVTGSFKARGAFNALINLRDNEPSLTGVVAMSSGNHGKAVAYAAQELGLKASVIVPSDSSSAKLAAVTAFGAELIADGITLENRDEQARLLQIERGVPMVHPFDDWSVIHGQGTIALEILEDSPDVQCIVVPIGGGGLLSGVALAAKGLAPTVRIVGVEPTVADDARQTLLKGRLVRLPAAPQTIADGVRTLEIGQRAYETMVEHGLVDEIVTVDEGEIIRGLRYASKSLGLAIEPTAALPVAAWLAGKLNWDGSGPIVLVLTGGNFEEGQVEELINN